MNSIKTLNLVAEKFLLLIFSLFLIFAPYEHKYFGKTCFWSGLVIWLLINILKYKQRFYRGFVTVNPLNKPILIFGIACLFSIVTSLNPYHSWGIFFERYLMYAVIFWITVGLVTNSQKNLYVLMGALLLSSLIFGFGGLRDYYYFRFIGKTPGMYDRVWTVFNRIIPYYGFPLYLTYFFPIIFFMAFFSKNKLLKIFCAINAILLFICTILNFTRATWISIAISLMVVSFLRSKRFFLIIFLSLILLTASGLFFYKPIIKERIKNIVNPYEWSNRMPLYKSSVLIWKDYPLFGVGVGMFEKTIDNSRYKLPADYPVPSTLTLHAHNIYLELAAETGLFGLLSFLLIFLHISEAL